MKKRYVIILAVIVGTFSSYKLLTKNIENNYIESLENYHSFIQKNIVVIEEKIFSGKYDENGIAEILNRLETYQYIETEIKDEELIRNFKDIVLEQRSEFESANISVYKEFYEATKHLKEDKEVLEKVVNDQK
ncbi:MAG: hypothetical protein ACRC6A_13300 [Fusobacteriaceae bacterium]